MSCKCKTTYNRNDNPKILHVQERYKKILILLIFNFSTCIYVNFVCSVHFLYVILLLYCMNTMHNVVEAHCHVAGSTSRERLMSKLRGI